MPGRDGTGPLGQGAMTGGGFGFCNSTASQSNLFTGRGIGRMNRGNGGGRGICRRLQIQKVRGFQNPGNFNPNVDEKQLLENEINILENELINLKKRQEELK